MTATNLAVPGLLARAPHLIDLQFRDESDVAAWQLWGARSPDAAYGNPTNSGVGGGGPAAMFTLARSRAFISPTARQNGAGPWGESTRGTARAFFDVDDYVTPAVGLSVVPPDEHWLFLRAQQNRTSMGGLVVVPVGEVDAGDPIMGPILAVPPARSFGMAQPSFTLSGTAPSNTSCTVGAVPLWVLNGASPNPMHIVFPRPLSSLRLQNTHATRTLLFSYGAGQIMQTIPPGEQTMVYTGQTKELVLARQGLAGGCTFDLTGTMLLGQ